MKRCRNCGEMKPLSEFHPKDDMKDGHQSSCRECQNTYMRKWRYRGKGVNAGNVNAHRLGGPYRVVYCPCNSFTYGSSFRRSEIAEMLENEYLAIGTRFRRGVIEYEVSSGMTLQEVTA